MSTIASPRDPSTPIRRVPSSSIITPTSSNRPSLDASRSSAVTSPVNNGPPPPPAGAKRANRAALREYYKLRAAAPRIGVELPESEVPVSDMDMPDFKPDEYISRVVAESCLEELLRLYTRVVGEVRALDAEKKALVYDNYSKLIDATETIRKVNPSHLSQTRSKQSQKKNTGKGLDEYWISMLTLLDAIKHGPPQSNGFDAQPCHCADLQPGRADSRRPPRIHTRARLPGGSAAQGGTATSTSEGASDARPRYAGAVADSRQGREARRGREDLGAAA